MKKEIMNLLKTEGTFRINNVAYLSRWTKSALNEDVDMLVLQFDNINNVNFAPDSVKIESRDFEGIITECEKAITGYFAAVAADLNKCLRNGYRKGV